MASNNLVANAAKTVFMILRKTRDASPPRSIRVGPASVLEAENEKLLGLRISKSLAWKDHLTGVNSVHSVIRQRLLLIRRLKYMVPKESLVSIVEGLVLSKVRYGLAVFSKIRLKESDPVPEEENSVQVALNDIMRLLCNVQRRDQTSINKLLQETGLLSFNQLSAQSVLLLTWKIVHGHCPSLSHLTQVVSSNSTRVSRSQAKGDLVVPGKLKKFPKNCFRVQAAKLWNAAPMAVKNAQSLPSVKKEIKEFVKTLPI